MPYLALDARPLACSGKQTLGMTFYGHYAEARIALSCSLAHLLHFASSLIAPALFVQDRLTQFTGNNRRCIVPYTNLS